MLAVWHLELGLISLKARCTSENLDMNKNIKAFTCFEKLTKTSSYFCGR
uniref:Uncharacterized protein n=1 Tax=Rhizophora mucronata TaxID=61149 RepID=A0A2P2NAR8_RHIMU